MVLSDSRGRERDPPPEQEAAAGTEKHTERGALQNNQRLFQQNVAPTQTSSPTTSLHVPQGAAAAGLTDSVSPP